MRDYGRPGITSLRIMDLIRVLQDQICVKLTSFATYGSISPRMTVKRALIDTFSGSINLWGLLRDSGLSDINR